MHGHRVSSGGRLSGRSIRRLLGLLLRVEHNDGVAHKLDLVELTAEDIMDASSSPWPPALPRSSVDQGRGGLYMARMAGEP
jgi:hypothetical protein